MGGIRLARPATAGSLPLLGVSHVLAAVLATTAAARRSAIARLTHASALSPGLDNAGRCRHRARAARSPQQAGRLLQPGQSRRLRLRQLRPRVPGRTSRSSGTSTGSRSTTSPIPPNPTLRTAVVCPGGQGEVSVYGNLLFMSAEESRARTDCGSPGVPTGDPLRFRGVRIFDISNLDSPVQVADGADLPRLAHAHAAEEPGRRREPLRLRVGNRRRPLGDEMASCKALPADE